MSESIKTEDITTIPIGKIATLSSHELYQALSDINDTIEKAKRTKQRIDSAIGMKYAEHIRAKRQRLDKETGTIHIEDGDYQLTTTIPKKISWNQGELATALAKLAKTGEDVSDYVEVEYKIFENEYKAWPQWVRDIFDTARSFDTGKPSYKITAIDGRAA